MVNAEQSKGQRGIGLGPILLISVIFQSAWAGCAVAHKALTLKEAAPSAPAALHPPLPRPRDESLFIPSSCGSYYFVTALVFGWIVTIPPWLLFSPSEDRRKGAGRGRLRWGASAPFRWGRLLPGRQVASGGARRTCRELADPLAPQCPSSEWFS